MGDEDVDRTEHELWTRLSEDVSELKKNDKHQDERIQKLETNDALQDHDIQGIKATLGKIETNTDWIRKTIGKAFITALFGGGFSVSAGLVIWVLTH